MSHHPAYGIILVILLGHLRIIGQSASIPDNFFLVYEQDFERPQDILDFEMSDPEAWKVTKDHTNHTLELHGASIYEARVRSPFNIALIRDIAFSDFILEVELAQSGREYGHRDLCLFFGFQDPTNFYYVHIASVADDHANNIFIVNDEPRVKIGTMTSDGTDWGEQNSWHKVRIVRTVKDGMIRIYFDDFDSPIMESTDSHFHSGQIGFGSFDDTGHFDNIKIWSPEPMQKQSGIFRISNTKN